MPTPILVFQSHETNMQFDQYLLPNHPSLTSLDPLGICEDGEDIVNHFRVLQGLVSAADIAFNRLEEARGQHRSIRKTDFGRSWCKIFTTLLQDIAYSLHGDGSLGTQGMEKFLSSDDMTGSRLAQARKTIFANVLGTPTLFGSGSLAQLCATRMLVSMTSRQVDTLLSHMLLGTLSQPLGNTWGRPGFGELFSHAGSAAQSYLQTLFEHFAEGGYTATDPNGEMVCHLYDSSSMPDPSTCDAPAPVLPVRIVDTPSENAWESPRSDFVLVAAHSQPGPGPNGTQEERLVGQSPALATVSLLKPVLGTDEVIITSDLWSHSSWQGHGREARMTSLFDVARRPRVRYIIADALELDAQDDGGTVLLDLRPGNVDREVRKLYAAFVGAKESRQGDMKIEVPPWGCGAFGGSLSIKAQCMMIAVGLAAIDADALELVVTKDRENDLAVIPKEGITVRDLFDRVTKMDV